MGKFALLLVAAAVLGSVYASNARLHSQERHASGGARAQQHVLAERQALSVLGAAESEVRRDFAGWRQGYPPTAVGGGQAFELEAEGPASGPVRLTAVAASGGGLHRVEALLARLLEGAGALVLDADTALVTVGPDAVVSGHDTPARSWYVSAPVEGEGVAHAVPGMFVRASGLATELGGVLGSNVRGSDRVSEGDTEAFDALIAEAKGAATLAYTGAQTFTNATFGTAEAPEIVHVEGDATFYGASEGYGVLLVEGDLRAAGAFAWHGLVVTEGQNGAQEIVFEDDARVLGAVHVLNEAGYTLGAGFYPFQTLWAISDEEGILRRMTIEEDTVLVEDEGVLDGLAYTPSASSDATDVEGFAFLPDGTVYLANNKTDTDHLYRIDPGQFDGDPETPVAVVPVGPTGQGDADEVFGLLYHGGSLFGISKGSRRIYRMDTATGAATVYRTFSAPAGFVAGGLAKGPDGSVYTTRLVGSDLELWRFGSFPDGDPAYVQSLGGRYMTGSETSASPLAVLADGTAFTHNRALFRQVDPAAGSALETWDFPADVDAMAFYEAGESGISDGSVSPLDALPHHESMASYSAAVAAPAGPDVQVDATFAQASGMLLQDPFVRGMTLEGAAANARVQGAKTTGGLMTTYSGPEPLPLLEFMSPRVLGGTGTARVEVAFSEAWTRSLHLYVGDLDFYPLYITAYDASGNPVSTAGWTVTWDLDIVAPVDAPGHVWEPAGAWSGTGYPAGTGRLSPNDPGTDKETSFVEIRVDNFAAVRSVAFEYAGDHRGDFIFAGFANETLFASPDPLAVTVRDNAEVLYSAESLGALATLLSAAEGQAATVRHSQFGRHLNTTATGSTLWQTAEGSLLDAAGYQRMYDGPCAAASCAE